MFDIGIRIPETGQYIMIIAGAELILAGVVIALFYFFGMKKAAKAAGIEEETEEGIEKKTGRRSNRYK